MTDSIILTSKAIRMNSILVTGATGKQGGSLVRNLLSRNAPVQILAVTRNAKSSSALELAQGSSNVTLIEGNLDDPAGIFKSVKERTSIPIQGVFSVQVYVFEQVSTERASISN